MCPSCPVAGGRVWPGSGCNTGVVIDWSKYCRRLVSVDAERRRALVEPGACLDDLNAELSEFELMVGPKPSTHDTCTIGGMIGNNSCGASAQAYGKMADSVVRMEVLTYDGTRMWLGGRAQRCTSGFLARAADGRRSTGRCGSWWRTTSRSSVRDTPTAYQSLVVLGLDDIAAAGDAVPAVAEHDPLALEGVDDLGKNRNHPDLRTDGDVDTEVERLVALGARRVDIGQTVADPFVVLADPERNEFCVLRGRGE